MKLLSVIHEQDILRKEIMNAPDDKHAMLGKLLADRKSTEEHLSELFAVGMQLYRIKTDRTYEMFGYRHIYDYSDAEYGIKKSTCCNLILVVKEYGERDENQELTGAIKECYRGYSYSQLVAMLNMDEETRKLVKPGMGVREINAMRTGRSQTKTALDKLSDQEKDILSLYRSLNETGKTYMDQLIHDICSIPKYTE